MFIHNIQPYIFKIGFFELRYYSLVYILGFLLAYFMLQYAAKNNKIKNLTKDAVEDLMIYVILGVIIGGRLGEFIFYRPEVFWTNPLEILRVWNGGMAFHGAIIGVVLAYFWFKKKHDVKFYDLADLLVIPAAFALFLGRIANFINGELWGIVTNVSWCVEFPRAEGCRHPSQLYEALKNLIVFGVLMFQHYQIKVKKGVMFWTFVVLYGLGRFIVNFWREDLRWFGISMGQYLSLAMVIVGVYFLFKIMKKK